PSSCSCRVCKPPRVPEKYQERSRKELQERRRRSRDMLRERTSLPPFSATSAPCAVNAFLCVLRVECCSLCPSVPSVVEQDKGRDDHSPRPSSSLHYPIS